LTILAGGFAGPQLRYALRTASSNRSDIDVLQVTAAFPSIIEANHIEFGRCCPNVSGSRNERLNDSDQEISFEETEDRLKVVLPLGINWLAFILHSLALLIWLGMLGAVLVYLIDGRSSSLVLTAILLLWLLIWLWFGRFLWTRWQYHAANREILFIEPEQLVLRRPVSILGLTWTYDMNHISRLYYSEQHDCPAFDYAYSHVYFGRSLGEEQSSRLIEVLNDRYFPEEANDEIVI
jgi:hypothetical protein